MPAADLDAAGAVTAYKNLSHVERDFRSMKAIDLDLRPIRHWTQDRVKAHVLICMLAAYLTWHLRHAWAPLTYTDEHPTTTRPNPVAPAKRSESAQQKASRQRDPDNQPLHDFTGLLDPPGHPHPQRPPIRPRRPHRAHPQRTHPHPTPAFDLLNTPIPLTLK